MSGTVFFLHGAWMTPLCWEPFAGFFERRGWRTLAPAWPYHDRPVAEQRRAPAPELARLGAAEILDHYERLIRAMPEPPFLVGHSFGGLWVQLLLGRGVGRAGVAIDSAPPRGVLPLQWSAPRSTGPALLTLAPRSTVSLTLEQFRYAFVHTLPDAAVRAAWERHVVPETRRIIFQAAAAPLDPVSPLRVNFAKADRAPLLLVAGADDHIVPAAQNRSNYAKYRFSPARTGFKEFPGRTHWIIAQDGWEEVAGYVADWLEGTGAG